MNERLTSKERIRKKREFQNIYKRGKRINSKYFTAIYLPNNWEFSRLGISVSKSLGRAVKRNKAKRWIRELFRRNKELFKKPIDVIFIPKKSILEANWQDLQKDYRELISNIFKGNRNEKNCIEAYRII